MIDHKIDEMRYYDSVAPTYALEDEESEKSLKTKVFDILRNCFPKLVLDMGCGTGRFFPFLRGESIIGIDLSKRMLIEARKKKHHVQLVQSDMFFLPFREETFDVIVSMSVLGEHAPLNSKVFNEIDQALSRNGILIFTVVPLHHRIFRPLVVFSAKLFRKPILSKYRASKKSILRMSSRLGHDILYLNEIHSIIPHYFIVLRKT